jgi:hypothetical protein
MALGARAQDVLQAILREGAHRGSRLGPEQLV